MKNQLIALLSSALLFSACNNNAAVKEEKTETPTEAVAEAKPAAEKMCFHKAENRDSTFISLTIEGEKVAGEMVWNPYQKDGATGTLVGTKNANGELELVYDYMIEGNKQSETKIMKIEGEKLMVKRGELIDPKNDGNMVFKDAAKTTFKDTYTKGACK